MSQLDRSINISHDLLRELYHSYWKQLNEAPYLIYVNYSYRLIRSAQQEIVVIDILQVHATSLYVYILGLDSYTFCILVVLTHCVDNNLMYFMVETFLVRTDSLCPGDSHTLERETIFNNFALQCLIIVGILMSFSLVPRLYGYWTGNPMTYLRSVLRQLWPDCITWAHDLRTLLYLISLFSFSSILRTRLNGLVRFWLQLVCPDYIGASRGIVQVRLNQLYSELAITLASLIKHFAQESAQFSFMRSCCYSKLWCTKLNISMSCALCVRLPNTRILWPFLHPTL